jgi:hypothetical protein
MGLKMLTKMVKAIVEYKQQENRRKGKGMKKATNDGKSWFLIPPQMVNSHPGEWGNMEKS